MNLKLSLITFSIIAIFTSCKPTLYSGYVGQNMVTEVSLDSANFNVLGSFSGTATAKKLVASVKNSSGVISAAKADLIENAKKAGVSLTGSRTLINVTTDVIQNQNRVTCTMSAEIIEFK